MRDEKRREEERKRIEEDEEREEKYSCHQEEMKETKQNQAYQMEGVISHIFLILMYSVIAFSQKASYLFLLSIFDFTSP